MTTEHLLIALLRAVLCGTSVKEPLTFPTFKAVYKLAAKHDLAHLVYHVAMQNDILPTPVTDEERAYFARVQERQSITEYRYVKLEAELMHVGAVFEREHIPYIPLKGSVLRVLYPEPWMRTSCDIDILVHETDFDRAVSALTADGFETDGVRHYHDQLLRCDHVNLELHHNILERCPRMDAVLATVWDHTVSKGCQHVQKPEFFVFHHIAHMAYHFLHGGCGIRTVMDLWLLRQSGAADEQEVRDLCQQAALLTFYEQISRLADVWFGDGEHDEVTRQAEAFILCGGAFGSNDQLGALHAIRHGRFCYLFRTVLMPYRDLKQLYPALDGHPWKTPYYQVRRLFQKLGDTGSKRTLERAVSAYRQPQEMVDAVDALLSQLGLHEVKQ